MNELKITNATLEKNHSNCKPIRILISAKNPKNITCKLFSSAANVYKIFFPDAYEAGNKALQDFPTIGDSADARIIKVHSSLRSM